MDMMKWVMSSGNLVPGHDMGTIHGTGLNGQVGKDMAVQCSHTTQRDEAIHDLWIHGGTVNRQDHERRMKREQDAMHHTELRKV
jgi:hypothetical protein